MAPAPRMGLDEIADRLEIQQLFVEYSDAIDNRDWDALDAVFTTDATIDYEAMGGIRGDLKSIKAFLEKFLGECSGKVRFMHMNGASRVVVDGNSATSRTPCLNPMVLAVPPGADDDSDNEHVYFCGLWYHDELVKTPDGWRIRERREERAYKFNRPDWV